MVSPAREPSAAQSGGNSKRCPVLVPDHALAEGARGDAEATGQLDDRAEAGLAAAVLAAEALVEAHVSLSA